MSTARRGEIVSPRDNPNRDDQESIINEEISRNVDESMKLGGETPPLHKRTLGQVVAYFKYQSTKEMNKFEDAKTITRFWQRNYYEHIIRNEKN